MRVAVYAALVLLVGSTGAFADACSDFDAKVSAQFAGPIAAADTACEKTRLLVNEMVISLKAPHECITDSDRAALKAGIKQSKQSYRDQGCG